MRAAATAGAAGFGEGRLQVNWRAKPGQKSSKLGSKRKPKPPPRRDDHSGPLITGKSHIAKVCGPCSHRVALPMPGKAQTILGQLHLHQSCAMHMAER